MKRQLPMIFAMACATAYAAMAVQFGNLSAAATSSGLRVTFTASGLQANSSDTVTATADATAVWGCFNRGGNNPNAKNKRTTVNGQASGSATFTSGSNGSITGSVNLRAPSAGNFSCPAGQTKALSSVQFTNVRISESATGASANVPGTFSKTIRPLG
jgi:hypothetical protein